MEDKGFDCINVIPLVDVMLVLLTIVLTTSTFVAIGSMPVDLPRAREAHGEGLKALTVEIDVSGHIFLNARPVSLEGMKAIMGPLERSLPVLIRADRAITLQVFVDVLETVKTLGFTRVNLQLEHST